MSVWLYRAYGLVIRSSFPIPEMMGIDPSEADLTSVVDVDIQLGPVPERLESPVSSTPSHDADSEQLLLRIPEVGRFLVSGGSSIVVDPVSTSTDHEVRVYLLGTCFGGILHQRGFLVIHASGIGTDLGAALFAGPSGAGKSTLLGELLQRGHRMMVDDVSAVSLDGEGVPTLLSSYPRTRLWADSADRLDIETDGLERTRSTMNKFERQVPEQFWPDAAPLRRLYHLTVGAVDEPTLTRLDPIAAFPVVVDNTYRSILLDGFGLRRQHFDLVTAVATRVPVIRVVRPADQFRLAELADLILGDLLAGDRD